MRNFFDREGFRFGRLALQAGVLQGEGPTAHAGADGDKVTGGGSVERIEGVGLLKIEPWQLPVRDEQAVLDEPAHDAGDDAIQGPIPDWRESFASVR